MKVRFVFLGALALTAACGREMLDTSGTGTADMGAAGTTVPVRGAAPAPEVGVIDLSQAPSTFSMTCDGGGGPITFANPCLVGNSFSGSSESTGPHEVECTIATAARTVGWSFVLTFPPIQNPQTLFPLTPTAGSVGLADGQEASISTVQAALAFERVDPTNRAFVARFVGVVTWAEPTGMSFQCKVDTPLWGAPGDFT